MTDSFFFHFVNRKSPSKTEKLNSFSKINLTLNRTLRCSIETVTSMLILRAFLLIESIRARNAHRISPGGEQPTTMMIIVIDFSLSFTDTRQDDDERERGMRLAHLLGISHLLARFDAD